MSLFINGASPASSHVAACRTGAQLRQRCCIKYCIAYINLWPAIVVEVGYGHHTLAWCIHVRNSQKVAVNVIGAEFVVVAVQDDGSLHSAVVVGILHQRHRSSITRINLLRHIDSPN